MKRIFSGFSLIEVVVSSAIAATVIGALFATAAMTIRLTVEAQERLVASELARDGVEIIRQIRDVNYVSSACNGGNTADVIPARRCNLWYNGILTAPNDSLTVTKPPVALSIAPVAVAGFKVSAPVTLTPSNPCTDYIVRNLDSSLPVGNGNGDITIQSTDPRPVSGKKEVYCRRLIIEPIASLPETQGEATSTIVSAFRVRSQVAWLGYGRNMFRVLGDLTNPTNNSCSKSTTEWCTEQTSILTNWRPVRL